MINLRMLSWSSLFILLIFWGLIASTNGSLNEHFDVIDPGSDNRFVMSEQEETVRQKITANLIIEDMDKTIAFYRDTLGFELAMTQPEEPPFVW